MSLVLYRLGRFVSRHAWWVIAAWALLAIATVLAVGAVGRQYDDSFTIPGSPSQQGMGMLSARFPQAAGVSAQIVFTAPEGARVTDEPYASDISQVVDAIAAGPQISAVSNPVDPDDPGVVSADGRSALSQVQFSVANVDLDAASLDAVSDAAHSASATADQMTALVGGTAYAPAGEHSSIADIVGIAAAFLVLLITFGSWLSAGLPLATAIVGVVVTDCLVGVASALTTINSTAPVLALMIGLAVGIDYALFILSRHRRQLGDGVAPEESIARTLGTAGSAVVFAGTTVVIALCGLAVANIPFLTTMGLCAAAGVTASVLVSLTLLPALAAVFGRRLAPRGRRSGPARGPAGTRLAGRWVALVTRHPIVTVVAVSLVLAALVVPAFSLSLALNDNGSAPAGTEARQTYDTVATEFGPGYNAPLLVVGDVITSTDPRGDVDAFGADISALPGVAAVGRATPNTGADTALVQVIPEGAQSSPETIALVAALRDQAPAIGAAHHISDVEVTGQTAVSIDVAERLAGALLPFGLVVVGLSLVLLAVVFRSILVPLKATVGYVLSIGVSFGVVTAVFNWGWGAALLGVAEVGPVISFLPIIVMGVLFGLAMDYEVFLVSRIREDYARTADAQGAVRRGFITSAPVVAAAGIIMVSVFVAFVPTGSVSIKPIAVALAVGVFVDAFVVRMTLVPAVLALLGDKAWWLPSWLASRLPSLDIEGESVEHAVHVREAVGEPALWIRDMVVDPAAATRLSITVPTGRAVAISGLPVSVQHALVLTVAGRRAPIAGDGCVGADLIGIQSARLQRSVACFDAGLAESSPTTARVYAADRLRTLSWLGRAAPTRLAAVFAAADGLLAAVAAAGGRHGEPSVPRDAPLRRLTVVERFALECGLAGAAGTALLAVVGVDRVPTSSQRHDVVAIAVTWCRGRGAGALLASRAPVSECDGQSIVRTASSSTDAEPAVSRPAPTPELQP